MSESNLKGKLNSLEDWNVKQILFNYFLTVYTLKLFVNRKKVYESCVFPIVRGISISSKITIAGNGTRYLTEQTFLYINCLYSMYSYAVHAFSVSKIISSFNNNTRDKVSTKL